MPSLAERIDYVLGVDTHKHTHTAAVVTAAGGHRQAERCREGERGDAQ